jgi:perosamine synthetase
MREIAPGVPAVAGEIPLAVPDVGEAERAYVDEVMRSGWVSSAGPFVDRFEEAAAETVGRAYAVATVSGSAALHVALLLAGVRPGDEVPVSTLSFISPANAISYCGAHPVFIDAEPDYWQMDAERLAEFLASCTRRDDVLVNPATDRRVAVLLAVGILGHPFDADAIRALADEYGLAVVEDAAEGLGARYRDEHVGQLGHISALSFNGNKIVTSGGGGMVVTDDANAARRARYLTTTAKDDPVEYVHGEVGFNYRLSNVSAALGYGQLERLGEFVEAKRRIAATYAGAFAGLDGIAAMQEAPWATSTFWMFTVTVDEARFGMDSRALLRTLASRGIQARPLWQPLHLSPAHAGAQATPCPVAERLHATALSLPCSVALSADDQARVLEAIRRAAA